MSSCNYKINGLPKTKCKEVKNLVSVVIFNPATKEVFDKDKGLIGYGEIENGILKITHASN